MKKYLLLIFILSSCNKSDDIIPPDITQENTFSCTIEGEVFVPETHGFYGFYGISTIRSEDKWSIMLSNGKTTLLINLTDLDNNDNSKTIQESDGDFYSYNDTTNTIELKIKGNPNRYYYSYGNTGFVSIEKFENEHLILKFDEIELISIHDTSNKIKLTNGKLNINLNTLNQ